MDWLMVMLWPLVACLVLPWLLVYYGLHVVRREVIFVDLALAQVAALGSCLAILLGHDPHEWQGYGWSLAFTLAGAALFTITRTRDRHVSQEALIGVVYVVAAAAALLLLSHTTGGDEELRRTLVGEILVVQPWEIWRTFGLFLFIGAIHWVCRRPLLMISFFPDLARRQGLRLRLWDFLFYAMFGFVVTSFVHIGGVLLVFSYLIVPAVGATLLVGSFAARMALGWGIATAASLMGLAASYHWDLPTGAAIVCALGLALVGVAAIRPWVRPRAAGG